MVAAKYFTNNDSVKRVISEPQLTLEEHLTDYTILLSSIKVADENDTK